MARPAGQTAPLVKGKVVRGGAEHRYSSPVISASALAGYLLEEVVARILHSSGYRLVVPSHVGPPTDGQVHFGSAPELLVEGRGAGHQVDVLGDFLITPPFSLPIRMFTEAKARSRPVGLPVIRNAVGTIMDVSQFWTVAKQTPGPRYRYVYTIFSTTGFSSEAQKYGLAHQISMVDMSGPEWAELRQQLEQESVRLISLLPPGAAFPVRRMRWIVRERLQGTLDIEAPEPSRYVEDSEFVATIDQLTEGTSENGAGALLGFPSAPVPLFMHSPRIVNFSRYAREHPTHPVTLAHVETRTVGDTWRLRPAEDPDSYELTFSLPPAITDRLTADEDGRVQASSVKDALGRSIMVLLADAPGEEQIVHLRMPPRGLRRLW